MRFTMFTRLATIWLGLFLMVCMATTTPASTPLILTFEATLSDSNHGRLQGLKNLNVSINKDVNEDTLDKGTTLWSEGFDDAYFVNGFVSLELGHISRLSPDLFEESSLYVVVEVDGIEDPAFFKLYHTPYAVSVGGAKRAGKIEAKYITSPVPADVLVGDYPHITGLGAVSTLNIGSTVSVNNMMVVDVVSGNIGLFVTKPEAALDVSESIRINDEGLMFSDGFLMETAVTRSIYDSISDPGSYGLSADNDDTGDGALFFNIGDTNAMTVTNSGWVGIGTANPEARLDVQGEIIVSHNGDTLSDGMIMATSNQIYGVDDGQLVRLSYPTNEGGGWQLNTETKTITTISPSANVGIGRQDPQTTLHVNGDVIADKFYGTFDGDGQALTNYTYENFGSAFDISVGGTNYEYFEKNAVILGNEDIGVTGSVALQEGYIIYGGPSDNTRVGPFVGTNNYSVGIIDENLSVSINEITNAIGFDHMEHAMYKADGDFYIMTDGYVGINTENPKVQLDLNGGLAVKLVPTASGSVGDMRYNVFDGTARIEVYRDDNWFTAINLTTFGGWTEDILNHYVRQSTGITIVGVGTTRPLTKMHVVGGMRISEEPEPADTTYIEFDSETSRFVGHKGSDASDVLDIQPSDGYFQRQDGQVTLTDPSDNVVIGTMSDDYKLNVDGLVDATSFQTNGLLFPFSQDNDQVLARVNTIGIGDTQGQAKLTIKEGTSSLAPIRMGVDDFTYDIDGSLSFTGDTLTYYSDELYTMATHKGAVTLNQKIFTDSALEDGRLNGTFTGEFFLDSTGPVGIYGQQSGVSPTGSLYTGIVQLPVFDSQVSTDDPKKYDLVEAALPDSPEGTFLYESSLNDVYFYDGSSWLRVTYNPILDGPFVELDDHVITLTEPTDRVGIGKKPSVAFDIDGALQSADNGSGSSGFYKQGVQLPWQRSNNVVYIASDKMGIGVSSVESSDHVAVNGTINATGFTVDGGALQPAGDIGGDFTGEFPNPELKASGVTSGTYGSAESAPVLTVSEKGLITSASDITIAGVSPAGAASGDLRSIYPFPIVQQLHGRLVKNETPDDLETLFWDAENEEWVFDVPTVSGDAGGTLDGMYPEPILADSGVTAGVYGASKQVGVMTIDASGMVVNVENITVSNVLPGGSAGGDLTGDYPSPTLVETSVEPGIYGSAKTFGQFTVDAKGRLTAATTVNISGVAPGGSAGGDFNGTYPDIYLNDIDNVAGTYGNETQVGLIDVEGTGLISSVSHVDIAYATPTGSAGGDLSGTYPNPSLAALDVDPSGTYGSATTLGQFTVNQKGLVESVSSIVLAGFPPAGPADEDEGDLGGTYPDSIVVKGLVGYSLDVSNPLDGNVMVFDSNAWSHDVTQPSNTATSGDFTGDYPELYLVDRGLTAGDYGDKETISRLSIDEHGLVTDIVSVGVDKAIPNGQAGGADEGSALTGNYPDALELVESGVDAGTYGSLQYIPEIEVSASGLITDIQLKALHAPPIGDAGGALASSYPDPELGDSGVTEGTYGSDSEAVVLTISDAGVVTDVEEVTISGASPGGAAGGYLSGTYPAPELNEHFASPGTFGSGLLSTQLVVSENGLIESVVEDFYLGGIPAGPAGGDLGSTFPSPTVEAIQGFAVSDDTPTDGFAFIWDHANSEWVFQDPSEVPIWYEDADNDRIFVPSAVSYFTIGDEAVDAFVVGNSLVDLDDDMALDDITTQESIFGYWTHSGSFIAGHDSFNVFNGSNVYGVGFGSGMDFSTDSKSGTNGSAILSGLDNANYSESAVVVGRLNTSEDAAYSFISGYNNSSLEEVEAAVKGNHGSIFGGTLNNTKATHPVIYGGAENEINNKDSVIMSSYDVVIDGEFGVAASNKAEDPGDFDYIFMGGNGATVAGNGAFAWRDNDETSFTAAEEDQFIFGADGGIRVISDSGFYFYENSAKLDDEIYASQSLLFHSERESLFFGYKDDELVSDSGGCYIQSSGPGNNNDGSRGFLVGEGNITRGSHNFMGGKNNEFSRTGSSLQLQDAFVFGENLTAIGNLSVSHQPLIMLGMNADYKNTNNTASSTHKPVFVGNFSGSSYSARHPYSFDVSADLVDLNSDSNVIATGSWSGASDRRFKTNIVSIDDAMSILLALRPVTYEWNDESDSKLPGTHIGLIAQEVADVLEPLTTLDSKGYYGVVYDGIFPILAKGVQEQQSIMGQTGIAIEDSASSMQKLDDRMASFEARLAQLEQQ